MPVRAASAPSATFVGEVFVAAVANKGAAATETAICKGAMEAPKGAAGVRGGSSGALLLPKATEPGCEEKRGARGASRSIPPPPALKGPADPAAAAAAAAAVATAPLALALAAEVARSLTSARIARARS
jgi:hypothetical protein